LRVAKRYKEEGGSRFFMRSQGEQGSQMALGDDASPRSSSRFNLFDWIDNPANTFLGNGQFMRIGGIEVPIKSLIYQPNGQLDREAFDYINEQLKRKKLPRLQDPMAK
jgi:hypothetical protein